ncbi:MAG: hypothetical protein WC519_01710 [Parcubacteria group bacterium]
MNIKEFFESKTFKKIMIGVGIFIGILIVLQLGIRIGYRKASTSYRAGDNFRMIFGGQMSGRAFMAPPAPDSFFSAHGATGTIIGINLPRIAIETPENVERSVLITDKTEIKKLRDSIKPEELRMEDKIVVIGSPNSPGEIEARLIRYLPFEQEPKIK